MVYRLSVGPVLSYRANVVPLDGAISKIEAIDQTPDGGVSHTGVYAGRPVHLEHFPTRMRWEGPPDPAGIGDFNDTHLLNVSERAKAFIEAWEAGVHQFVPVAFVDKGGAHIESRHFWIVGNRRDSVDRERTTYVLRRGRLWTSVASLVRRGELDLIPPSHDLDAESRFAFNSAQIGGAHIWRDKHLDGGPLVSDAFGDALAKSGLTGIRAIEMGETV